MNVQLEDLEAELRLSQLSVLSALTYKVSDVIFQRDKLLL